MAKKPANPDLLDGLQQAKAKPRYYAVLLKGQTVVGMIVRRKKLKPAELQKARLQAKAGAEIQGVCTRNAADLVLQVVGELPAIAVAKIRDYIDEQTDLKLKPQWVQVAELAAVPDDVEEDKDWTVTQPTGPVAVMIRCRQTWEATRRALDADVQAVAQAVQAHCANPEEYDPREVQGGIQKLSRALDRLDGRLLDKLDAAMKAEEEADQLKGQKEAATIVQEYLKIVSQEPLLAAIDDNGLVAVSVREKASQALAQLATQLTAAG